MVWMTRFSTPLLLFTTAYGVLISLRIETGRCEQTFPMSMMVLRTLTGTLAGVPARHGSIFFNNCSTPCHANINDRVVVEPCP